MNLCEQAEAFRLLLLMKVVSKSQLIAWADDLILNEHPLPEWVIDISLSANDSEDVIESPLREIPFEGNRLVAAASALDRFAIAFRAGNLPPRAAAWMLQRWAAHSNLSSADWLHADGPVQIAQDVEYGYLPERYLVDAINKCLTHFAAASRI